MPARNIYHDVVIRALREDGWTITDDPLQVSYGGRDLYVDLGAERSVIGAERGMDRIAVEIQSFVMPSSIRALQEAVGQYEVYRVLLKNIQPGRRLYMAVPRRVDELLLSEAFGLLIVREMGLKVMVFDEDERRVVRWIG